MTDDQDNIERFKAMAGRILGALYAEHPKAQWNDPGLVYGGNIVPEEKDADLYEDTVNYLEENGYIISPERGFIRLRDKGYQVLQKPNPLDPKKPLGTTLTEWAQAAAGSAVKDGMGELGAAALDALYGAIGLGR